MPPHDAGSHDRRRIDWPGWIALAWAVCFGFLYVRMLVEQKAPRLASLLRHAGRP